MPLINFGSILNFAEEIESKDAVFYSSAVKNQACSEYKDIFLQFEKDAKKNIKTAQRTRRENVTEMILEPIKDFTRAPFIIKIPDPEALSAPDLIAAARSLEERAESYYQQAALKIKAQPEVARALKMIGKKRTAHINKLKTV